MNFSHISKPLIVAIIFFSIVMNITAQQSKVDSAIMYLNKSFATSKLDSASLSEANPNSIANDESTTFIINLSV